MGASLAMMDRHADAPATAANTPLHLSTRSPPTTQRGATVDATIDPANPLGYSLSRYSLSDRL
jgi:hypothetical protein